LFLDVSLGIVAVPQYKHTESAQKWRHGYKPTSTVKSVDKYLSVVDGDPYVAFRMTPSFSPLQQKIGLRSTTRESCMEAVALGAIAQPVPDV